MSAHLEDYRALIAAKAVRAEPAGFAPRGLSAAMKPHQRAVTDFALRQGRAALFLDTGLGKTLCALEWGREVVERTNRPVLMLAPLAVAKQHEREAERFGIDARAVRDAGAVDGPRVWITNYDRAHLFDSADFAGVVLDESSILKSFTGSQSRALRNAWTRPAYRLACTATPAPNDHMELGQHAEFCGAMAAPEMLSRWFVADQSQMGRYRLKKSGVTSFWRWMASWSRAVAKPSDLGFDDAGYDLPPLDLRRHIVRADRATDAGAERDGQARLFRMPDASATAIHREKRLTVAARADVIAALAAAEPNEAWVVWCDTDYEADELVARMPDAVEVRGSMSAERKESALEAFALGHARVIVSKPSVCGWGLNWQHAARVAFVGLSYSYEAFYQAIRRCWRFGQTRSVQVHVASADTEDAMWRVVSRKQDDHRRMQAAMAAAMREAVETSDVLQAYRPTRRVALPTWIQPVAAPQKTMTKEMADAGA